MPPATTTQMSTEGRGDYETDSRWTSIDAYTVSHLHPPSRPNHSALTRALRACDAHGLPDIGCPSPHGKFFALQCRMLGVRRTLEVGALGGYSAIWLATEDPAMAVTSVERDPCRAGRGLLPRLHAEVESGARERFGFAFIDADKVNNYRYFDWAVRMSVPGACVCVDNVVSRGKLAMAEEAARNDMVRGARECVERVGGG
ncbi:hypothetical protein HO173_004621 [Letharia columbiana]|uniref:O-methyltransferase n=1 Tax=Letharia columbiana TaxID=112416 RepID=A0A8H6FYN7_9LECA|nr:uncharacterized protein HO173_004621 [Letharia columbiana]KAF6237153.1 hypothetical protein HO173_004621 [Letharia columbiana]